MPRFACKFCAPDSRHMVQIGAQSQLESFRCVRAFQCAMTYYGHRQWRGHASHIVVLLRGISEGSNLFRGSVTAGAVISGRESTWAWLMLPVRGGCACDMLGNGRLLVTDFAIRSTLVRCCYYHGTDATTRVALLTSSLLLRPWLLYVTATA